MKIRLNTKGRLCSIWKKGVKPFGTAGVYVVIIVTVAYSGLVIHVIVARE